MNGTQIKNGVLAIFSVVGTIVTNALGGWDDPMKLLAVLMAADYITGVMVAGLWKKSNKSESGALDSRAGFKGLARKGAILLVVLVGHHLDLAMGVNYVRNGVILFFAGNEGLSLLENLGLMGIDYPDTVKKMFQVLQEKGTKNSEESGE
jgi:toxin secretion/phage lysis holin